MILNIGFSVYGLLFSPDCSGNPVIALQNYDEIASFPRNDRL
ncbi:hypothetical protein [Flavobacterium dankookense]|nr:hypothetical protein [Flavobacterium dankookense]